MPWGWPVMVDINISKIILCKLTCLGQSTPKIPLYKWLTATVQGEQETWEHLDSWEKPQSCRRRMKSPPERQVWSLYMAFWSFELPFYWLVGEAETDMVSLGLAESGPCCWQLVLFDVPCWVSELASAYDLNYDQRRDACCWMTGYYGQTGSRVVEAKMEDEIDRWWSCIRIWSNWTRQENVTWMLKKKSERETHAFYVPEHY